MRFVGTAVLVLALAGSAEAQHRGFGRIVQPAHPGLSVQGHIPFRTFGSPTGFGNVLFPGTGHAPPLVPPHAFPATFPERLSATVTGFGFTGVPHKGFFPHKGFGKTTVFPLPVPFPVYVDSPFAYQQPPHVTIVLPPQYGQAQAAQGPGVAIHQHFTPEAAQAIREYGPEAQTAPGGGSPSLRTYEAPTPAAARAPEDEHVLFLIALSDSTVYTAVAYWVEDQTLHYITPQGRHNKVSLELVDREVSAKLNQGRQIAFRLPAR